MSKLQDKLFLIKFIHEKSEYIDLDNEVKKQIKSIFLYFKQFLNSPKLEKKEETKLNKYLDLINTCDPKQILNYGNKILSDAKTVYTG